MDIFHLPNILASYAKHKCGLHSSQFLFIAGGVLVAIIPLALLLRLDVGIGFYDDWFDNLWFIGYTGEYFLRHFSFPATMNTDSSVGIMVPSFYGYTLYPVLGVVSAFLGSNLTARIALLLLYIGQFFVISIFTAQITKNRSLGFCIGLLTVWNTYFLTTIYNRGSLPEVFSGGFLTIALVLFLKLFWEPNFRQKVKTGCLFGLALTLAVGSWPAVLPQAFLLFATATAIVLVINKGWPNKLWSIVITLSFILFMCLVLLPWFYITAKFYNDLSITGSGLAYYGGIDEWFVRFCPFPFDGRSLYKGLDIAEGTPYLDAQVNIPLLLLFCFFVILMIRSSGAFKQIREEIFAYGLALVLILYFIMMSVSPPFAMFMPDILRNIHFHYRFITYINLALLLGIFCGCFGLYKVGFRGGWHTKLNVFLAFCIGLSLMAVLIKNVHGNSIIDIYKYNTAEQCFGFAPGKERNELLGMPGTAGHVWGYRTLQYYRHNATNISVPPYKSINIPVSGGNGFGQIDKPVKLDMESRQWVSVNMYPFIWNTLQVDGKDVDRKNLHINNDNDLGVVFQLDPGVHEIKVRFVPDPIWMVMRDISYIILFVWIALAIVLLINPKKILGSDR